MVKADAEGEGVFETCIANGIYDLFKLVLAHIYQVNKQHLNILMRLKEEEKKREEERIRNHWRGFSSATQKVIRSRAVKRVCLRDDTNTKTGFSGECVVMAAYLYN